MQPSGKIYFASDLHLGVPDAVSSREREMRFIRWLDMARTDAAEIFIVGDIFDFWHEYATVVPKGFVRLQGKLAALADAGITVHVFTGNHDLWMFGYLEQELGVKVYKEPIQFNRNGKRFFVGHGDGLGPGDHGFKFMKKVFTNPLCQFLFKWMHPDIGVKIANYLSHKSRFGAAGNAKVLETFKGAEHEWLIQFAQSTLRKEHYDYFLFGHRHLPLDVALPGGSRYINTGDWIDYNSYAVFDGEKLELKYFES